MIRVWIRIPFFSLLPIKLPVKIVAQFTSVPIISCNRLYSFRYCSTFTINTVAPPTSMVTGGAEYPSTGPFVPAE